MQVFDDVQGRGGQSGLLVGSVELRHERQWATVVGQKFAMSEQDKTNMFWHRHNHARGPPWTPSPPKFNVAKRTS